MPVDRCTSGGGDLRWDAWMQWGESANVQVEAVAIWHQKKQLEQIVAPIGRVM